MSLELWIIIFETCLWIHYVPFYDSLPNFCQIAVQAVVRGKVIARGNIKPYRKDVAAKLVSFDEPQ